MQHYITFKRFILTACLTMVAVFAFTMAGTANEATLTDTWQGAIQVPGQPLDITVRLQEDADGTLQGTADIPIQGGFDLALHQFHREDNVIAFAFVDIAASFTGEISDNMQTIEGTYMQSGMEFPFVMERESYREQQKADDVSLDRDTMRQYVNQAMEDWSIPGLALAIVHDGELVMSEGFGWRDVENELPVTEHTLFGIGSVTKSFTATAFQMLADEGLLSWDQPIREHIPEFRLHDAFASDRITPLDFALHRSGLPRHDMLWLYNENFAVEKLLTNAEHLMPGADFRTAWMYNNLGYAVLGNLIERAAGESYASVIDRFLLQPLQMNDTNFTIEAMQAQDDFALAYTEQDGEFIEVAMREFGGIGAAGAINSNVTDMAQWVLFHLNNGDAHGEQLVSEYGMQLLHTPHITIPGAGNSSIIRFTSYSLGWMIDSYRDHYRIHHGGNTLGYSAHVAMVPEQNLGVVVLVNTLSTLPELLVNHVIDTVLGYDDIDWSGDFVSDYHGELTAFAETQVDDGRVEGTSPGHALHEYSGEYTHPAYGQLTIEEEDGQLTATYYDATFPVEHWHFEQFRGVIDPILELTVPFYFQTDASGHVNAVEVGFEPTVDPIPFQRVPSEVLTDTEYLAHFVGAYETMGLVIDVTLRNGTLILTVPGQPPYTLQAMRENAFAFQDYAGFGIQFTVDDDNRIERAILVQPHGNIELQKR